jgi:protein-tyrosine kinase
MVIERALEKLRETTAAKTGTRSLEMEASRKKSSVRPEARSTAIRLLPVVTPDVEAAEARRVLLPDASYGPREDRTAAAFRLVRTRLLNAMRNEGWSTLAITSPGPGEGKSLITLNLALSIARERMSDVFLLDLDLRNPSICGYLGVCPPQELVSYFGGDGTPAGALFTIGIDGLAIAGSTLPTEQASELIASGRLEEMLAYIRSIATSPIILLDLPPLLVTDEALLVAPRVDAVALVVAEGRTRRDTLVRAKQLLSEFTMAGVILNRSSERHGADKYYGYHYREGDS